MKKERKFFDGTTNQAEIRGRQNGVLIGIIVGFCMGFIAMGILIVIMAMAKCLGCGFFSLG